jgi:hypothetical protein
MDSLPVLQQMGGGLAVFNKLEANRHSHLAVLSIKGVQVMVWQVHFSLVSHKETASHRFPVE